MRATDMTKGKPGRLILLFALPLMLGNVCQQMYTIVDGAFVGRFAGIDALAALGAADWLSWLFFSVIIGFAQGFSILVSQRFGARDEQGLRKSVAQSVLITFLITLLLLTASQSLLCPILRLMETPESIFPQAVLYIRILLCGLPVNAAYNLQAGLLRAVGDSRSPLIAMMIASLTNIALDALFVIRLRWGVAGAAAATVIAQTLSALYCFMIVRKMPMLFFTRQDLSWHGPTAKKLILLGAPAAAQNIVIGAGGLAVQRVINGYGSVFIAGFTATNKLYGLMEMAGISFGASIAAYTGQNYGAREKKRIRDGVRSGALLSSLAALMIAAALFFAGKTALSLFVDPGEQLIGQVLNVAQRYLNFMLAALVILYLLYVYRSALQGMGDTLTPMVSGMAELTMRVSAVLILPRFLGQDGVFFAEPAAWLAAEVILMLTYWHKIRRLRFSF